MAVVCRAKVMMRAIEAALERRGLAYQSMNAPDFRHFDWKRKGVKLSTMHSAKGLEFRCVFVAGLQSLPMRDECLDDALRLLYVAMTRSTGELVLSAHGPSGVVTRVRQALEQVLRQFSRMPA